MTITQTQISREEEVKSKFRIYLITKQLYQKDLANLKHLLTSLNTCIKRSKLGILKLKELSCTLNVCTLNAEVSLKSRAILEIILENILAKGLLIVISVERHSLRVEI